MHKCIIGVVMQEGRFGTPIGGTILRETLGPTVTKKKKKKGICIDLDILRKNITVIIFYDCIF